MSDAAPGLYVDQHGVRWTIIQYHTGVPGVTMLMASMDTTQDLQYDADAAPDLGPTASWPDLQTRIEDLAGNLLPSIQVRSSGGGWLILALIAAVVLLGDRR